MSVQSQGPITAANPTLSPPHLGGQVDARGHDTRRVMLQAAPLGVEPLEVCNGSGLQAGQVAAVALVNDRFDFLFAHDPRYCHRQAFWVKMEGQGCGIGAGVVEEPAGNAGVRTGVRCNFVRGGSSLLRGKKSEWGHRR